MGFKNQKSKILNVHGFSLIELVFAMSFLTLIIMGVVNLQSSNLSMISSQNNQIQANFMANQGLSIVRALGYESIKSCSNPTCLFKLNFTPDLVDPSNNKYSLLEASDGEDVTFNVTPFKRFVQVEPAGLISAYKVTVIVEWEDSAGSHKRSENNSQAEAKTIVFNPTP